MLVKRLDCPVVYCNCKPDEKCYMSTQTSTECSKITCVKVSDSSSGSSSSSNKGAIAGGVVGGVVGAIVVAGICLWFFYVRRNRKLKIDEDDEDNAIPNSSGLDESYMDNHDEKSPSGLYRPNYRESTATMSTVNSVGVHGSNVIPIAYIPGVSGVNNRIPDGLKFTASDILRDDSIRASIATTNYRGSTAFIGSDTMTAIQARPNLVDVKDQQMPVTATFMKPSLLDLDQQQAGTSRQSSSEPTSRPLTRLAHGDRMTTYLNTIEEVPTPAAATKTPTELDEDKKMTGDKENVVNQNTNNGSSQLPLRISVASDFDVAFPSSDMDDGQEGPNSPASPGTASQDPSNLKQVNHVNSGPNIPVPAVPGSSVVPVAPALAVGSSDRQSNSSSSKRSSKSSSNFRLSRQALRNSALNSLAGSNNSGSQSTRSSRIRDSDYYVAEDLPMEAVLYAQQEHDTASGEDDNHGRSSPFDDKYEMTESSSKP